MFIKNYFYIARFITSLLYLSPTTLLELVPSHYLAETIEADIAAWDINPIVAMVKEV